MKKIVNGVEVEMTTEEVAEWEAEQAAAAARPGRPMDVDRERDRRSATFTFNGVVYQTDAASMSKITAAGTEARFALMGGAAPLADEQYEWIAADNTVVPMDAATMAAFADAATAWVSDHALAARTLKDTDPIPREYADDQYWPVQP